MGSAGYPRYLFTVAPATALITLAGWNELAPKFAHLAPRLRLALVSALLATSAFLNFIYADGAEWTRDALLVEKTYEWWPAHQRPFTRLIWSQPYMCMLLDGDPWQNELFTQNAALNRQLMQDMPPGTLRLLGFEIRAALDGREDRRFPGQWLRAVARRARDIARLFDSALLFRRRWPTPTANGAVV
jgi:hypothetical protein